MAPSKACMRCKRLGRPFEHPLSDFYKDPDGRPLPTCRVCRRELAKEYHKRVKREERAVQGLPLAGSHVIPNEVMARTVVQAGSGVVPHIAIWRCMSCYRKAITRGVADRPPGFPSGWRNLKIALHNHEEPSILCGPCSTILLRARKVLARIVERIEQEHKAARA